MKKLYIVSLMFLSLAGFLASSCEPGKSTEETEVETRDVRATGPNWNPVELLAKVGDKEFAKFEVAKDRIEDMRKLSNGAAVVVATMDPKSKEYEPTKLFFVREDKVIGGIDAKVTNGNKGAQNFAKDWTVQEVKAVKKGDDEYFMFTAYDKTGVPFRARALDSTWVVSLKDGKLIPVIDEKAKKEYVEIVPVMKPVETDKKNLAEGLPEAKVYRKIGDDADSYVAADSKSLAHSAKVQPSAEAAPAEGAGTEAK